MITSFNFKRITVIIISAVILIAGAVGIIYTVKNARYPVKYKEEIFWASEKNGVNAELIFAVIKAESNFDKNAVSGKGAVGLMQVKPSTALYVSQLRGDNASYDLKNEKENIDVGSYYLAYLIKVFGDINTALLGYNAGEGKVKTWLNDERYSTDGKTVNNVPYKESREYLEKVNRNLAEYKKILQKYC